MASPDRAAHDATLLSQAVRLAQENALAGERPFGALAVLGGEVVGTGVNTVLRSDDPTAHAEVQAIRDACARLGTEELAGAVVYTSCEPCVMCTATACIAGVALLVFAATSAQAASLGFPASPHQTLLQDAWRAADPGYVVPGEIDSELAAAPFLAWTARFGLPA